MNIHCKTLLQRLRNYSLFISCLSLSSHTLSAQELDKNKLSIEINATPFAFSHIGPLIQLIGGPSHSRKNYFSLVAKSKYELSTKWSVGAGLGYSTLNVITTFPGTGLPEDEIRVTERVSIWELPLEVNYALSKNFFTYLGPVLHLQQEAIKSLDRQSGIGGQIGFGVQFPLKNRFSVVASTSYKLYSLIPFNSERHNDRISILGINLGIKYSLYFMEK